MKSPFEGATESKKNFNDYYNKKMNLIISILNFFHSLHTIIGYLDSHLCGSKKLNKIFTDEYLSQLGNQEESHDQERIRNNLTNLTEVFIL